MNRVLVIILLLFSMQIINAQPYIIKGTVVDAEKNNIVTGATVFINQTMVSARTNSLGAFQLEPIDATLFDIVVSKPGYQTLIYRAKPEKDTTVIRFQMLQLDAIAVDTTKIKKEDIETYTAMFLDKFIGRSANATQCEILNPEILKFSFNDSLQEITVSSTDFLQVINDGLGYLIFYELYDFRINTNKNYVVSLGYSFFKPLTTSNSFVLDKWKQRRADAYNGSLMHFIRSLYNNTFLQEGFEVRKVSSVLADDYKKIGGQKLIAENNVEVNGELIKVKHLIHNDLLPPDSIFTIDINTGFKQLKANQNYQVIFKKEKEPLGYLIEFKDRTIPTYQTSYIHTVQYPVYIFANGSFFDPVYLTTSGYMNWEKLPELLPVEYKP